MALVVALGNLLLDNHERILASNVTKGISVFSATRGYHRTPCAYDGF